MERPLPVLRAGHGRQAGCDPTTLRRRCAATGPGRLVRVGPNAFVEGAAWDRAGPRQQYVTRVYARLGRIGPRATASHHSAAAVHGLPGLGGWALPVHATVPPSMYRVRSAELVLHTRPIGADDRLDAGGIAVTAMPRTVVDLAMTGDLRAAVVAADVVLARGVTRSQLRHAVDPRARGRRLAEHVVEFADARSGSPAESLARVVFDELGLPTPVLQQSFVVDGSRSDVDFWFPDQGVVIEVDGRAKYTQERYLQGRTPAEVFIAEKRRHERLLTVPGVRVVLRIEWRDLFDLDALVLRLRAAGMPVPLRPVSSSTAGAA